VHCILLLVPAGECVDEVLLALAIAKNRCGLTGLLHVVDCGNSFYVDTAKRHEALISSGIVLCDAGVSGGVLGARTGYCVMAGASDPAIPVIEPILKAFAMPEGYAHVGGVGAGHYIKMVHNAIEYGIMQAYGEGFHLLKEGAYPALELAKIAHLWGHGSIIRSHLLTLLAGILEHPEVVDQTSGVVNENGTGRWAALEARRRNVTLPAISAALEARARSRETGGTYATKLVALLRHAFGGHAVEKETDKTGE